MHAVSAFWGRALGESVSPHAPFQGLGGFERVYRDIQKLGGYRRIYTACLPTPSLPAPLLSSPKKPGVKFLKRLCEAVLLHSSQMAPLQKIAVLLVILTVTIRVIMRVIMLVILIVAIR